MRRILTLIAMLPVLGLFGQSEKIVLAEHFTQASCPPCATVNPIVFPILEANHDKVAVLAYQVSWPGYDPMNEHNPGEVQTRVSYYGVRGVPNSVLDGVGPEGSTGLLTQQNIDLAAAKNSPFDLDLQVEPNISFSGLEIDLGITANSDVSGALVAHVVVVEDEIDFGRVPPGTNGETVFHYVMKKMLPTARGTTLATDWTAGQTDDLSFSYEFENFYDWQHAGVVVFIQNNNNKRVLQAQYWEPSFEANEGDDVLIQKASASGDLNAEFDVVCGGTTNPKIVVMNSGKNTLNSFDVEYSVNGSAAQSYTWNGTLATFSEMEVDLPSIDFPIQLVGELDVNVKQPNGQTDQYPENGELLSEFLLAPTSSTTAQFEIRPLIRPGDVSFKIRNSEGDVILEDGPFSQRTAQTYDLTLEKDECYEIEVRNQYTSVNGTYKIRDDQGQIVVSETIFGQGFQRTDFGTYNSVSSRDLNEIAQWTVAPNPAVDRLNLDIDIDTNLELEIRVSDLIGKTLMVRSMQAIEGNNTASLEVADLKPGIYFVSLMNGDRLSTKKFVKQ